MFFYQAVYNELLFHHFCIIGSLISVGKSTYVLLLPTHNPRNINVQTVPCLGQSFVSLALSYLHLPKQPCVQIGLLAAKKRRQEILPTLFLWVHIDRANGHKKNILVITNAFTAFIRTVSSKLHFSVCLYIRFLSGWSGQNQVLYLRHYKLQILRLKKVLCNTNRSAV